MVCSVFPPVFRLCWLGLFAACAAIGRLDVTHHVAAAVAVNIWVTSMLRSACTKMDCIWPVQGNEVTNPCIQLLHLGPLLWGVICINYVGTSPVIRSCYLSMLLADERHNNSKQITLLALTKYGGLWVGLCTCHLLIAWASVSLSLVIDSPTYLKGLVILWHEWWIRLT